MSGRTAPTPETSGGSHTNSPERPERTYHKTVLSRTRWQDDPHRVVIEPDNHGHRYRPDPHNNRAMEWSKGSASTAHHEAIYQQQRWHEYHRDELHRYQRAPDASPHGTPPVVFDGKALHSHQEQRVGEDVGFGKDGNTPQETESERQCGAARSQRTPAGILGKQADKHDGNPQRHVIDHYGRFQWMRKQ